MRCKVRSDSLQGWIIDAQLGSHGNAMDVWMFDTGRKMHRITVPWCARIHVHAIGPQLDNLRAWLSLPEISTRFTIGSIRVVRMRLSLDEFELHDVLEIEVINSRNIRRLAQHIESHGDYHRFTLYSIDAHIAQRFFIEYRITPFEFVEWDGQIFSVLSENDSWPNLKIIELNFNYLAKNGFNSVDSKITDVKISEWDGFCRNNTECCKIVNDKNESGFLHDLQSAIEKIDPDIIVTKGGDALHFSVLGKLADTNDVKFNLSRKIASLAPRTMSRVVHSYGQVIRKDSYFPLHGRLHLDLDASFIVREGGVLGLFELSRHSRQSPQDISRLSPGSVISAIQMRIAMEDGVLVPWKKNRAEDTKTAWELLAADRGGLYLDSKPGVYSDVIELDFASLFPSIIATRNISPETLNCACCQTTTDCPTKDNFVPLNPELANSAFRERKRNEIFISKIFPSANPSALQVPGLKTHTCAQIQGFLGRVVAPLIERRMQLKKLRKKKGDLFDLQQNALKWLLVTCFGYTGYKNARFGRIEAHEAICAWARDILLTTISVAEEEGWTVLHAIVDCIWIENKDIKSRDEKVKKALELSQKITDMIGIPLEFEDMYDIIGFLPSRMHGSGSLTKYWAHGGNGFKLRGIEARQHSTCEWIRRMQIQALELLMQNISEGNKFNSYLVQKNIISILEDSLQALNTNLVSPIELVVTKRVTKRIPEFAVTTTTQLALIRAKNLGHEILPGRKVRYVVTKPISNKPLSRVILSEELTKKDLVNVDVEYYKGLAIRAIWAILGPFGWTDDEIINGKKKFTLFDFIDSFDTKSAMDDFTC